MEPVRGYSLVFCEFKTKQQYKVQILQMRKISIFFLQLFDYFLNISRSGYEQDVEFGNTAHLGDCHGTNLIHAMPFILRHLYIHTQ